MTSRAYAYIDAIATALASSSSLASHCVSTYGRGCLVRVDDWLVRPPTSDDAPVLIVCKVPRGERDLGDDEHVVRLVAGVAIDASVTVVSPRSSTANGLEVVRGGREVAELLELAAAVAREVPLGADAIIARVEDDIDGLATPPLQVAALDVIIQRAKTLETT